MGFLDSAISAVSPRRAYERELWRQALGELRGYDAAGFGRLNAGWRVHNESAEITDRGARDVIRARARDLEKNSDIFQAVLRAYRRNVVGKGYTLQAKTGDDALDDWVELQWKRWCKAENCDTTGAQSFYQILGMAFTRKKVDGGVLIVKRYTKGGLVPFKLQLLEVDELDTSRTTPRNQGNTVVGGIEFNREQRAVGYWVRQYDLTGWQLADPVYLDAKDVIFYRSKTRPSQLREMPDMAPVLTRVRDVNEFITAVSVKERIAACLSILIKKTLPTGGIGRSGGRQAGDGMDYSGKKLGPGMIMEMGQGDEAQIVDPKGAATDAAAFLKTQQGLIGAGQGLSYETVSRDMSHATYSSARQAAIEDEDTFAEEIELLTGVMSEIYETFIISGYLAGLFNMPGFWERKAAYLAHTWVKSPRRWIDPAKEAAANKLALQSGQKSVTDILAEQGKDWKEYIDETVQVLEYARDKGLDMGGVLFGNGAAAAQQNSGDRKPDAGDE